MRPRSAMLTALLVGTFCLANSPAQEPAKGHASPRAVFDAAVKASKKKDYKAFCLLLTPKSQTKLVDRLAGMGMPLESFSDGDVDPKQKDKLAAFDKIMAKHGLTKDVMGRLKQTDDPKDIEANDKTIDATVKDKPAFVNDMFRWFEEANPGKGGPGSMEGITLKDAKIVGDKATGTIMVKVDGEEAEQPIAFAKTKRGWLIVLPEQKAKDKK